MRRAAAWAVWCILALVVLGLALLTGAAVTGAAEQDTPATLVIGWGVAVVLALPTMAGAAVLLIWLGELVAP